MSSRDFMEYPSWEDDEGDRGGGGVGGSSGYKHGGRKPVSLGGG